jgi:ribosomal protein S18 acetylase RimI-like enzyme
VMVAVAPERRRLHIGSDLLDTLADEARRRGLNHLRVSYRADATLTDAFVHGCGLTASRRVVNGVVTAVLATTRKT